MIEIKNLTKSFETAEGTVVALDDVNLTIADGDIFGIIGMSGAGKSTLVRTINMLERPTSGAVVIDGVDMGALSAKELREARREITMIFQSFNLLMQRTVLKNVCFPLELAGAKKAEARRRAQELLEIVGLGDKAKAYPAQLSGGQQQRVAIARALATSPKVLLCVEATSALDPTTTHSILSLIRDINERLGITVVVITHQMSVVEDICRNVAILDHGRVVEQGPVGTVFSNPKSDEAKRMVFPDGAGASCVAERPDQHFVRVTFNGGAATERPLISGLAIELGIEASISYASSRTISGEAHGTMLLEIDGTPEQIARALEYMNNGSAIVAEEGTEYVG